MKAETSASPEAVRSRFQRLRMQILHFGRLLFIASIPSIILPIFFLFLAFYNSSGDRRSVLPTIENTWGWIGWLGGLPLWLPILAIGAGVDSLLHGAQANGYVIPYFDTLAPQAQGYIELCVACAINTALWFIPVYLLDWLLRSQRIRHKKVKAV